MAAYALSVAELPRGTVTFLFTDIEGSTRLLKRLGGRYSDVLAEHRRILREATEARGGREMDTQGDSFFFAFARANAALGAAVVAQRALAQHDWPEGGEVRVRMGLHTGEPAVDADNYVGLGVHRAARIGAVGHGGQVLLSNATRELVEDEVGGVSIRELGSYRLKDIDRPERLFQLDIEGLQTEFPPLKAEKVAEPRRLRRKLVALGALVVAAALAVAFIETAGNGSRALRSVRGGSLGIIDTKSNHIVNAVAAGAEPSAVAVANGAAWTINNDDNSVSQIDLRTNTVRQTLQVGSGPIGIAASPRFVWVSNSLDGTVSQIDPRVGRVVQTIPVGNAPEGVAAGLGSVWVANAQDDTVTRIDALTGQVQRRFGVPAGADAVAVGRDALWVASRSGGVVSKLSATSGSVLASVVIGRGASALAASDGSIWVSNGTDGTLSRIDAATARVIATIHTGESASGVAVGGNAIWVGDEIGGRIARIDPQANRVVAAVELGNPAQGLAVAGTRLLVAVRTAGASHSGGTLRILTDFPASIEPADYQSPTDWTNDGLVTFRKVGGSIGTELVPDLATSIPSPEDGGRTYTFQLRQGVRYSDGDAVKPADVRHSLERVFKLARFNLNLLPLEGLVGARRCLRNPGTCDLSRGVVADAKDYTVTFHLTRADPEFLFKLASHSGTVLPSNTPPRPARRRPLPATGPYEIARFSSGRELVLERNPRFREWSRAAQPRGYPDRIVLGPAVPRAHAVAAVIDGRADLLTLGFFASLPAEQQRRLSTQHADQVRLSPLPVPYYLFLNTRVPPFDDVRARRAVAYAVDRGAMAGLTGGSQFAQPTCQVVPPNFPGYRPYCPYTTNSTATGLWTAPDLTRARALVAASRTRGAHVSISVPRRFATLARRAVADLRRIGYRASLRIFPDYSAYLFYFADSRHRAEAAVQAYGPDYPAASTFFRQFTCQSFVPASATAENENLSEFCEPSIDRMIERARELQVMDPPAANALWSRIDRAIVDAAPVVPLYVPKAFDLVSKRAGNYEYSPQYGALIDQLWVR